MTVGPFTMSAVEAASIKCYSIEESATETIPPAIPTKDTTPTAFAKSGYRYQSKRDQTELAIEDLNNGLVLGNGQAAGKRDSTLAVLDFIARFERLFKLKPKSFPADLPAHKSSSVELDKGLTERAAKNLGRHLEKAKSPELVKRTLLVLSEFLERQQYYGRYFKDQQIAQWALEATDSYIDFLVLNSPASIIPKSSFKRRLTGSRFESLREVIEWQNANLGSTLTAAMPRRERVSRAHYENIWGTPETVEAFEPKLEATYASHRLMRLLRLPLTFEQLNQVYPLDPAYSAMKNDKSLFDGDVALANPLDASKFMLGYRYQDPLGIVKESSPKSRAYILDIFRTTLELNLQVASPKYFESKEFIDLLKTAVKLDVYDTNSQIWTLLSDRFFEMLGRKLQSEPADLVRFLDLRFFNVKGSEDRLWEDILLNGTDAAIRDFSNRLIQLVRLGPITDRVWNIRNQIMFPAAKVPVRAYLAANPNIHSFHTFIDPTGFPEFTDVSRASFKPVLIALIAAAIERPDSNFTRWVEAESPQPFASDSVLNPVYWAPKMLDVKTFTRMATRLQELSPRSRRVGFEDWLKMTEPFPDSRATLNSGKVSKDLENFLRSASNDMSEAFPRINSKGTLYISYIENPLLLLDRLYQLKHQLTDRQAHAISVLWHLFK